MPVMRKNHLVAGDLIENAERHLRFGRTMATPHTDEPVTPTNTTLQEFSEVFTNSYVFLVSIVWIAQEDCVKIVTTLQDQHGQVVDTLSYANGPIDRKYELSHDDDGYELTITRAAHSQLSAENISKYIQAWGNHCPFCRSPEFSSLSAKDGDVGHLMMEHRCANCEASWHGVYELKDVSNNPALYTLPRSNAVLVTPQ